MLRARALVVLGLAALVAHAPGAAADTVGVVVTGEAELQPPLAAQLEGWLRGHGHQVMARSLDEPSTIRLIDCLTVDDGSCARKVVEAQARSDSVVFARAASEGPTISLTVHWIVKGRPPVGGRRGCEPCTPDVLRGAADELMTSLAPSANVPTGRLKLSSKPEGLIVMLDGAKIGVTPIERDLAAGAHTVVLVDGGTRVGQRMVQIPAGATVEVTMPAVYARHERGRPGPSRLAPVLLWAAGGLALAGSGVAFYYGQKGGPDHPEDPYVYRGASATGYTLVGAGATAIGVGVWLWVRGSRESAPAVAISPGGSYLGWSGRF